MELDELLLDVPEAALAACLSAQSLGIAEREAYLDGSQRASLLDNVPLAFTPEVVPVDEEVELGAL